MTMKKSIPELGAGFLLLFVFVWLASLLEQDAPTSRRIAFVHLPTTTDHAAHAARSRMKKPLALTSREISSGVFEYELVLQTAEEATLAGSSEIGIEMIAPAGADVAAASLSIPGAPPVSFELAHARQGQGKLNLELRRSEKDEGSVDVEAPRLVITTRGSAQLGVLAQHSADSPVSRVLWTVVPGDAGQNEFASVYGWTFGSQKGPQLSRAQLLSWLWGLQNSRWIYAIVAAAACGCFLGCNLLFREQNLLAGLGAVFFFAGIGVIYAVIVPPLQAPDELTHINTFAAQPESEGLAGQLPEVALRSHVERIKFRNDQKFTSADIDEKFPLVPGDLNAATEPGRSPLGSILWRLHEKAIPSRDAESALLVLRFYNAFFVALCLGLGLGLVRSVLPPDCPAVATAAPALFPPAIAFFSMAVSNYPFIIGGYAMQAVALVALWSQVQNGHSTGGLPVHRRIALLAGLGVGVAVCSGDNGLASLAFWGVLIPAWAVMKNPGQVRAGVSTAAAFAAGVAVVCLLVALLTPGGQFLPFRVTGLLLERFPWIGLPGLAAALAVAVYLFFVTASSALGNYLARIIHFPLWLRHSRKAGAVALCFLVGLVLFTESPDLPDIQEVPGSISLPAYLPQVITSYVDGFGPGNPDHWVVGCFWGLLGWMDTPLPPLAATMLRWVAGVGVVLLAAATLRRKAARRQVLLFLASLAALICALLVLGTMYYLAVYNLHGRYLAGAYLLTAALSVAGYMAIFRGSGEKRLPQPALVNALVCCAAAVIHAASWTAILNRYF